VAPKRRRRRQRRDQVRDVAVYRQRLRVHAHRQAERELVLPHLNPDPAINSTPPKLKYNNFGATVGGPVIPSKMFFFFSEEVRRINRAPTALNVTTYDPAWLTTRRTRTMCAGAARSERSEILGLFPRRTSPAACSS